MNSNNKLGYIDALRGIAVLGVILVHTSGQLKMNGIISNITSLGAKGVQLFFFISAFTLFLSFNKRKNKEFFPVSNFFIRRFFRIAPLYYLAILYYIIQSYFLNNIISFKEIALNFTFTHGFSPQFINSLVPGGWSIAVEMAFYVTVPLLVSKINNLNKAFLFLLFSLILRYLFTQYFALHPVNNDLTLNANANYLYWYLPNQLPCFAFGILFYFTTLSTKKIILKKITFNISSIFLSSLFLSLFLFEKYILKSSFFDLNFIFCITCYFLATLLNDNTFSFLVNKITILIGKYSYSMYITHFIVLFISEKLFTINTTFFYFIVYYVLIVIISFMVSIITYNLIEEKAQLICKRIINKREQNKTKIIQLLS